MGGRHFEDLGDFAGVRQVLAGCVEHTHHRRHPEAGHRGVVVQIADDFHRGRVQTDFLLGFAQRRGGDIDVARLAAAARKAHLTAVLFQVIGAPRQQDLQPGFAAYQWHQHRGGLEPLHDLGAQQLVELQRQFDIADRTRQLGVGLQQRPSNPGLQRGV